MRRLVVMFLATSLMACVSLPRPSSFTTGPTDVLLLDGEWRGDFSSIDGLRAGSMMFTLTVRDDTARGPAVFAPVVYVAAPEGASVPMRAEARAVRHAAMRFVSVTDGVVTGVIPAYFDTERMTPVQTTFVGRLRGWNVIEGTYVALGPSLRVEEVGTWRVTRN
jgi:hypothetical protein